MEEERNYSELREKAQQLYNQLGDSCMSCDLRVDGKRAQSIDEVADENLHLVIKDLESFNAAMGVRKS